MNYERERERERDWERDLERDWERDSEREAERALAGEGERDLDLDLDLALVLHSAGEREREQEPRWASPPSSSLLGCSRPFEPDFLERSLIPDLERDLERERDLDSSFLFFFTSFLLFLLLGLLLLGLLLLGLRLLLRSLFFGAPLLRSSSFLTLILFFLLRDRLRELDAALERERLRLLLSLRLRLLRDLRLLERDLEWLRLRE